VADFKNGEFRDNVAEFQLLSKVDEQLQLPNAKAKGILHILLVKYIN